ncbi:MAG: SDR family NAD(P)-dependent oxidoreductase, partial [Chloroflexi bacterium]
HKTLVKSLHCEQLNPYIQLDGSPFYIVQENREWETLRDQEGNPLPRRAGVSSFGFGGVNAHVVLEEYVSKPTGQPAQSLLPRPALIVLSARNEERLHEQVRQLLAWLQTGMPSAMNCSATDVAYTLQVGREAMEERLALQVSSLVELEEKLQHYLQEPRETGDWYRGQVRQHKEIVALFGTGEELQETVSKWVQSGQYEKLLSWWVKGGSLDWKLLYTVATEQEQAFPTPLAARLPRRISLPTYPFAQQRYWIAATSAGTCKGCGQSACTCSPSASAPTLNSPAMLHPLVQRNISTLWEQQFSSTFHGNEFFLADHVIMGERIMPGVAHLEMAYTAVREALGLAHSPEPRELRLNHVVWVRPLIVGQDPVTVHMTLHPQDNGSIAFAISRAAQAEDNDTQWLYSQGQAVFSAETLADRQRLDLPEIQTRCQHELAVASCYQRYRDSGFNHGPAYQGIEQLLVGEGEVLARLRLPATVAHTATDFVLHPSLLDSALQASIGLWFLQSATNAHQPHIPFALEQLSIVGEIKASGWAWVRQRTASATGQVFDIAVCDDEGYVGLHLRGLRARELAGSLDQTRTVLLTPGWKEEAISSIAPSEPVPPLARQLVLLCDLAKIDASRLQAELVRSGHCPEVNVRHLSLSAALRQERFQDAVVQLIQALQQLWDKGACSPGAQGLILVQVVVVHGQQPSLLQALAGVLKTAQHEYRQLIAQLIEAEEEPEQRTLLTWLQDNQHTPQHTHISYREHKRCIVEWQEQHERSVSAASPWKEGGCYLITGGAGGLARLFVQEIAKQVKRATLVLVGRSPLSAEQRATLERAATSALHIDYQQVDVSDGPAVHGLMQRVIQHYGHLDGILHAAGVLRDSLLLNKTAQDVQAVLAPKVAGVEHLDEASKDLPLDFFVLCSSLAAVAGNVGQADYAAANAYLDAFAHARAGRVVAGERRGTTVSFNWPLWQEAGMQIAAGSREMMRKQLGAEALGTEMGMQAFSQALSLGQAQVLVLHGHIERIKQRLWPRSLQQPIQTVAVESTATPQYEIALHRLREALLQRVSRMAKVQVDRINAETELAEYGFDSITFTELANHLNQSYQLDLTAPLFFEYSTIESLARYLQATYATVLASHFAPSPPPTPPGHPQGVPLQWNGHPSQPDRPIGGAPLVGALGVGGGLISPVLALAGGRTRLARSFVQQVSAPLASARAEPIAIIGISGSFPQAPDIESFWENLLTGRDCISEIPDERWDWQSYFGNTATQANKTNIKWAGIMEDIELFDPLFFGISAREAEQMDPQQRLLMMYVWKAIEDAGYSASSLSGSNTALFVGTASSGYGERISRAHMAIEGYSSTGQVASVGPNRMSYFLNLHGPSEPIETACSSSLIAIHRGVSALESDQCSMAIVGGVNTLVSPEMHISFSKAGMLSEDGRCKTFSASANGYVRGEGVGMLVLKKLSEAEQAGDHIYGVIRASSENHGGRASSLTAPNPRAQADLLVTAYRKAGIDPATVGYIEAHGTGTPLGDPIEINGLKTAWSLLAQTPGQGTLPTASCGIGSVKSNIGHLELAAGIAGVIKVLLQMQHKTLVKSLHCEQLNPYIQLDGTPFYIVQENVAWDALRDQDGNPLPRRAGVSSFGFGGANAHVVLEEYVPKPMGKPAQSLSPRPALIVLSAKNEERLHEQVRQLLAWLQTGMPSAMNCAATDVAYTLQVGREAMEERLALQVSSLAELSELLGRYLQDPRQAGNWYRGQVRQHKETITLFSTDEELQEAVSKWLQRGKYEKLLSWWVKGLKISWQHLYGEHQPRRISLPTYPFMQERYWVDEVAAQPRTPLVQAQPWGKPARGASPQATTIRGKPTLREAHPLQTTTPSMAQTTLLIPGWKEVSIPSSSL